MCPKDGCNQEDCKFAPALHNMDTVIVQWVRPTLTGVSAPKPEILPKTTTSKMPNAAGRAWLTSKPKLLTATGYSNTQSEMIPSRYKSIPSKTWSNATNPSE